MPEPRTLTPARAVALVLIAVAAAGLAWLRIASGTDRLAVPAGARAGDLVMHPCTVDTDDGGLPGDCGTLVVAENRADPASRLIALPVTRVRSRSGRRAAPVFRLEGGPGRSNMSFPQASRYAGRRDVVMVGYRGVDGSSVLACPEVAAALRGSGDLLGAASLRAYAGAFRACADRLRRDGTDLAGYTLAQRADDLEAARRALGYGKVDLLSESAGTRTAMIMAWRHPASVRRSVMIGANPPGHFLWDAPTTDAQIQRYGGDRAAAMRRTASDMPDRWWLLPVRRGNVLVATFYGLVDTSSDAAPISAPMTLQAWRAAADGDAAGLWLMSTLGALAFPDAVVWGDLAAVGREDARAARRHFASRRARDGILGDPGTTFLWGGGLLAGAWPAAPGEGAYDRVRTSRVPTLVVGGELDVATPPQVATRELMPHLPRGHQVVLRGFAHTTDFWTLQRDAGTRLVSAFLDRGVVDAAGYVPQRVDLSPAVTDTTLAKGIAGGMLGLALLVPASLAGMALRVRRRGRMGRRAAVLVRTACAAVMGLGGWCLGALVVLALLPGVPVDDPRLAVLAVGLPVALAVHVAWTDRSRPAPAQRAGLAAAALGALAGGWLGFMAAGGLLALLTTVAGAVAGANLALIVLDMARARSDDERFADRAGDEVWLSPPPAAAARCSAPGRTG